MAFADELMARIDDVQLDVILKNIRSGEGILGLKHRKLDCMSGAVLIEYLQELRAKWKQRNVASGTASIAEVVSADLAILPAEIIDLAVTVGKKYGITGESIVDRYKQVCKLDTLTPSAWIDLRDHVLLDIDGKEESWEGAFVKPIKAGVLNEPMKPEPQNNPTPDLSELPEIEDAVPLIEEALTDGSYPKRPFVLHETEHELHSVICFADTARRYLKRPDDAVARGIITKLAWHLLDGWWR